MEQWISLIGNVGFPVIVTMYLLTRIESRLEQLAGSIDALNRSVTQFGGAGRE
jgi:hypothetical protein